MSDSTPVAMTVNHILGGGPRKRSCGLMLAAPIRLIVAAIIAPAATIWMIVTVGSRCSICLGLRGCVRGCR
ncbi:hypothetical protein Hdeb2414_s0070g00773241 [Helianthus debilis subsp. tardiflorus]